MQYIQFSDWTILFSNFMNITARPVFKNDYFYQIL